MNLSIFNKDLLERALKTFLQVFIASIVVPADVANINGWKAAIVAAVAAAISGVTSLLSKNVGSGENASLVH